MPFSGLVGYATKMEPLPTRFILNGLANANAILGEEVFQLEKWRVMGEYVYDDEGGRHQAFYSPVTDVEVLGETIKAHERIQVEQSLKYSQPAATKLWHTASLEETDQWTFGDEYGEFQFFLSAYYFIPDYLISTPAQLHQFLHWFQFQLHHTTIPHAFPEFRDPRDPLPFMTDSITSNPCMLLKEVGRLSNAATAEGRGLAAVLTNLRALPHAGTGRLA